MFLAGYIGQNKLRHIKGETMLKGVYKWKGKGNERKKLLNGHFWQLNGTDRGSECKKVCFFWFDRKVKYAWPLIS